VKDFSRRIRKLREVLGFNTPDDMATATAGNPKHKRLAKSSLYRWENADRITEKNAKRIALAFEHEHINWVWIYNGTGSVRENRREQSPDNFKQNNTLILKQQLQKEVFKFFEWEIDVHSRQFTFQKLTVDPSASHDDFISVPLDDLLNYIHEDDHDNVLDTLSDCLHDLSGSIHILSYRILKHDGSYQFRVSYIITEFDDFTIPLRIIGISSQSNDTRSRKNANQLSLID